MHQTDVYVQKEVPIITGDILSVYHIDNKLSTVQWSCGYTFASLRHRGILSIEQGTLQLDNQKIVRGSIVFSMQKILIQDLQEASEKKALLAIIQGKDFFHTDSFPNAILAISRVEYPKGSDAYSVKNESCIIHAALTIKGLRKELVIPATYEQDQKRISLKCKLEINRKDWGITYASATTSNILREKIIDDQISIAATIFASK